MKKIYYIMLTLLVSTLIGCGDTGGSSSSQNGPKPSPANLDQVVSIDAMTTVPNLNGASTKGVLYIHNYGEFAVSNISFNIADGEIVKSTKSKVKTVSHTVQNTFKLDNTSSCTSIAPGGYCVINFITPTLSIGDSGDHLVEMRYTLNGAVLKTHQVINYTYVDSNTTQSVNFLGSASVAMAQGKTRHVVGYLYATGNAGATYNNVQINKSIAYDGFKVVNGFVNNQQVTAGQVIAVEFELDRQHSDSLSFQAYAQANNTTSGNPASFTINPDPTDEVSFVIGQASIMQVPSESINSINIINNGSADATSGIGVTTEGSSNLVIDNGCSSVNLQKYAANTCQVSFSVTGFDSGNAVVEFKYNGEVINTQTIYWLNNKAIPSIRATPSLGSVSYEAGSTPSEVITYTLQNIGKAPLQSSIFNSKLTNTAVTSWLENLDTTTCGETINPGTSCSISGKFAPKSAHGIGKAYYSIEGSYDSKSYKFASLPVSYTINGEPILNLVASNTEMILIANNESTVSKVFTLTNIGNVAATSLVNTVIDNSDNNPKPEISGTTCTASLNVNESCTITLTYGPADLNANANESGIATVKVAYTGGSSGSMNDVQKAVNYKLIGNDSVVVIGQVTSNMTGSGTSINPFTTDAKQTGQTLSATYTNSGSSAMNNFNINTNNLPAGYKVDPSSTCPVGITTGTLAPSASCTLILTIDVAVLANVPNAQANMTIDFVQPGASWTTNFGTYHQAGNGTVYVNYAQAQLNLSATQQAGPQILLGLTISEPGLLPNNSVVEFSLDQFLTEAPTIAPGFNDACSINLVEEIESGVGFYSFTCDLSNFGQDGMNIILPMPDYLIDDTYNYYINFDVRPSKMVVPTFFGFEYVAPSI